MNDGGAKLTLNSWYRLGTAEHRVRKIRRFGQAVLSKSTCTRKASPEAQTSRSSDSGSTSPHDGFHTRPFHHEHHGGCLRIQLVSFAAGSDNDRDPGYLQ